MADEEKKDIKWNVNNPFIPYDSVSGINWGSRDVNSEGEETGYTKIEIEQNLITSLKTPLSDETIAKAKEVQEAFEQLISSQFSISSNQFVDFSTVSKDAKPIEIDVNILAEYYESALRKAEAKGIKRDWVLCVPPNLISIMEEELKSYENELAGLIPPSPLAKLTGIPIFSIHTESGQIEYMPYELALAKYGNQILSKPKSEEDEE